VVGAFAAVTGIYLLINRAPASTGWFAVQVLLGGCALLVLAAGVRRWRLPLVPLLGLLIVAACLHNGLRVLGTTSSPLYPPRYFARTSAITYAEQACAGHRTLLLDESLPRNVGDVYRRIRTQNSYEATLHVPFFDFTSASSWASPEQTRLLDLRCIIARNPLAVPGYRVGDRDTTRNVTVYIDSTTSPLNTPQARPVPATVLRDDDRDKRYRVDLARPTSVVISAIVYPGWHVQVDGRRVKVGAFRVGKVDVFPEVMLGSGPHTLEYSWSGWPS
jgi:hypothetical protein